ncbi:amino acid ABC transporter substrate-binding protein [Rhizobium indicum]|uniref:Amino acid ABC transporter substrate-binding protein n=1 Tax=Rhizobium indicum TaxID=2583231 RepID=A0ABX6PS54_9HYPH|nr:amino acid ABC transporter substrate-binding protein [Rhizobium indicum]QKK21512.1 amino acid ABC transporter substrate-binding protein [Rhizobium indicum]
MSVNSIKMNRRSFLGSAAAAAVFSSMPSAFAQETPIRVGGTLPLTGPLAGVGAIHKLAANVFVEQINAKGGILGRKVEFVLLDDQSLPANARTLYERLVTADKVDLLMGPYGTSSIIAAMGVAQRFKKLLIQSSLGDPSLAPYPLQFPSLPIGPEPHLTDSEVVLDAYTSLPNPPKTIAFITSKFPSALTIAKGGQEVAERRGIENVLSLEYEFGTKDFGAIANRIKAADSDLLWSGAIGMEAVQLLDAMSRIDYQPRNQFYLFPAPGPTAAHPKANGLTSLTWFEAQEPFLSYPGAQEFVTAYNNSAKAAGFPYPRTEYQAAVEFAAWQILAAAAEGAGKFDDAAMAAWLRSNTVETVVGPRTFEGKFNAGKQSTKLKQVQGNDWVTVWPTEFRPAEAKFLAP